MAYKSDNFANAGRFGVDLRKFVKGTKEKINKKIKRVAIQIHDDVIVATRIDTGRAASNWNVALGHPDPSIVEPPGSGTRGGGRAHRSEGNVHGSHAFDAHGFFDPRTTGRQKQSVLENYSFPDVIYISNSVPYIGYLEYGTQHTDADHMVLKALHRAQSLIDSL